MNSIQDFRNFYARYVAGYLGKTNDRLIAAFASVEREQCIGACDKAMSKVLASALKNQPVTSVKSLRRNNNPDASVLCKGDGWWLSTSEPVE